MTSRLLFFLNLNLFKLEANYFTILYWFCHTSTWIRHGCTRVLNPEPPSHRPPHTIPLGHPSAPAPSFLYPASNLDWRFVSYMILYMFQCSAMAEQKCRRSPIIGTLQAHDPLVAEKSSYAEIYLLNPVFAPWSWRAPQLLLLRKQSRGCLLLSQDKPVSLAS